MGNVQEVCYLFITVVPKMLFPYHLKTVKGHGRPLNHFPASLSTFLFFCGMYGTHENRSDNNSHFHVKAKQSCYTPRRRLGGEEIDLLLIPDLGTRWGWVVSVTPQPRFAPGKGHRVPIVQEAGWASEPVWTQRLEEKCFSYSLLLFVKVHEDVHSRPKHIARRML
jgi:hypothetical protein